MYLKSVKLYSKNVAYIFISKFFAVFQGSASFHSFEKSGNIFVVAEAGIDRQVE